MFGFWTPEQMNLCIRVFGVFMSVSVLHETSIIIVRLQVA